MDEDDGSGNDAQQSYYLPIPTGRASSQSSDSDVSSLLGTDDGPLSSDSSKEMDSPKSSKDHVVLDLEPYKDLNSPEKKALSAFGLISVVYFLVCGGSYGTEDLGGSIPPLLALLGIIVIPWFWSFPVALITAELATALPDESGFLLWSRRAFGPLIAFLDGWIMMIVVTIDQSLYPIIFVSYVESISELAFWQSYLVYIGYIIVCLFINLFGAWAIGHASKLCAVLALLPFSVFFVSGFFSDNFDPTVWFETEKDEWDLPLYMSVLIWATCGYEYSGFLAADVNNPRRTFPLVMFLAVILMIVTYLLPIAMALASAPGIELTEGAYPDVARAFGLGKWVVYFMTVGGLASTMGTYNAYLCTSATALRSLSREGMAPPFFDWLKQFKPPVIAIFFFSMTTAGLVLFDFSILVQVESMLYCIHALFLCSSVVVLRFKEPDLERPFKLPFGRWGVMVIATFPMLVILGLIGSLFWDNWIFPLIAVGLIVVGVASFYLKEYIIHKLRKRGWIE